MPKYRVVVYRIDPDGVAVRQFGVSGDAESADEALAKAAAKRRHPSKRSGTITKVAMSNSKLTRRELDHFAIHQSPNNCAACKRVDTLKSASGEPRFPDIIVDLSDVDGNVFTALGRVRQAMRRSNVPKGTISSFSKEATHPNGDWVGVGAREAGYPHVLATCKKWVTVK